MRVENCIYPPFISFQLILEKGLQWLIKSVSASKGLIAILNPFNHQIQTQVSFGFSPEEKQQEQVFLKEMLQKGKILPKIQEDGFIFIPIKDRDQIEGIIGIYLPPSKISKEILSFLSSFADFLANLIHSFFLSSQKKYSNANFPYLIGKTLVMQELFSLINKVAGTDMPVLISGEPGTGKQLVATIIHYNSQRKNGPFIKLNCAALSPDLLEKELFGDETGPGKLELTHQGTLVLCDIEALPLKTQAKLLSALQDKILYRQDTYKCVKIDVRIIAVTTQNLAKLVESHQFRQDLYYWLNVFPIYLPPLRKRRADIVPLTTHFLKVASEKYNKPIKGISATAMNTLIQHHWPGNVKELQNCIERAVLVCDEEIIQSYHLPSSLRNQPSPTSLNALIENLEKSLIIEALKQHRGKQKSAAAYLGISPRVLNYKLQKYKIDADIFK